jgi:hypothetical protein
LEKIEEIWNKFKGLGGVYNILLARNEKIGGEIHPSL